VAGGHDVVIDRAHIGRGICVFDESEGCHADQDSAPLGEAQDDRFITKGRLAKR
jgi:hypothetical protein